MFTLFFTDQAVTDYASAAKAERAKFADYFRGMLTRGIYLPPSQFEAAFLSSAHSSRDIEKTIAANLQALRQVYKK